MQRPIGFEGDSRSSRWMPTTPRNRPVGVSSGGWQTNTCVASGTGRSGLRRCASASATVADDGQNDRLGRHQSAGRVRLVEQQSADGFRLVGIHGSEQFLLLTARHLPEQIGGVVGFHLIEDACDALRIETLDQAHLLVLGQFLEQVGQALVLERLSQHPPTTERKVADLIGHLRRMQASQCGGLTVNRALLGEQLPGFAPINHLGCALEPGHTTTGVEGNRGDLPRERLGRGLQAYVDDPAAPESPSHELARRELLAVAQLKLPEIDRPSAQPHASGIDLTNPAGAHEHATPLNATDDKAIHAGRSAAQVQHDVDDVADIGSVRPDERESGHSRYVENSVAHSTNRRLTGPAVKLCNGLATRMSTALPIHASRRPTAFSTTRELTRAELMEAPIRYPSPRQLERPLQLSGVKAAHGAASLGLHTVGDLLEHLPRDRREARSLADLVPGETATVVVEVKRIAARAVRRRGMRPLVEATAADATGTLRVTFFNQPWLADRYPPGTRLILHGKADGRGGFTVQGHAPTDERSGDTQAVGEAGGAGVAHYPAGEGLSSTQILALVHEHAANFGDVLEPLPAALRRREKLLDRPGALRAAHFSMAEHDSEQGRRRLAFDELLLDQLALAQRRRSRAASVSARRLTGPRQLTARWLEHELPFPLTGDQTAALEEIDADMARGEPMQRLLMGEVGSGKTVVALYAMLRAAEHGCQAALMAPTETLADQHFQTVQSLLGSEPVSAGLLTGSTPVRRRADLLGKLVNRAALADRRDARADRGRRSCSTGWDWWSSTSSTASAWVNGRRWRRWAPPV